VNAAVISNEVPQARNLYVLSQWGSLITRVHLLDDTLREQVPGGMAFAFTSSATTGKTNTILTYGDSQRVGPGKNAVVVVRALGADGRALSGVPVSWSAADSTLSSGMAATNADGLAQAVLRMPAKPDTYKVNATVDGKPVTFSITVDASITPPPDGYDEGDATGPPTGPAGAEVVVVSGQGQVLRLGESPQQPLIAQALNEAGQPLPYALITWTLLPRPVGSGELINVDGRKCFGAAIQMACLADAFGKSRISFSASAVSPEYLYGTLVVTASSGSANATFQAGLIRRQA
jgi:hypothetical protein